MMKFAFSCALLACSLLASPVLAQDEGSAAWKFSENNNRLITFQQEGGDPAAAGKVKIDYFAHSSFRITTPKGMTLLLDPWRNDPSGAWGLWFPEPFPEIYADIALSTHAHFDHDAVHRVHAPVVIERPVGVYALGDVKVTGLGDKHMYKAKGWYPWTAAFEEFGVKVPPDNPMNLDNSIIVIETGGLRIVHWGDNRPDPPEHVLKALKGADVIFMPIDGSEHILTAGDMAELIKTLQPKVVIPCHYNTKGAVSVLSTLLPPDAWVDSMPDVKRLTSGSWTVEAGQLPKSGTQVVYFGNNYVKK